MKSFWKPALLLAAIAVMLIGTIGSGAWFTANKTTEVASIKSATLKLDDTGFTGVSLGQINNMAPGGDTDDIVITIKNTGTTNLGWFGNLTVSDSILKNVIYIKTAKMEFKSPGTAADWEPVDPFIKDGDGSGKWPFDYNGMGGLATLAAFDNNPSMAPATPYEFMGALKPGYSYKLTLEFGFYEGAGNEYQGAGPLQLGFTVNATQLNTAALENVVATGGNHLTWMNQQIAKQP